MIGNLIIAWAVLASLAVLARMGGYVQASDWISVVVEMLGSVLLGAWIFKPRDGDE